MVLFFILLFVDIIHLVFIVAICNFLRLFVVFCGNMEGQGSVPATKNFCISADTKKPLSFPLRTTAALPGGNT
jgi:hypothetical protein